MSLLCSLFLGIVASGCGASPVVAEPAVVVRGHPPRLVTDDLETRLEVPVVGLAHPERPGVRVLGAVHIADADYYATLAAELEGCGVVLHEGLTPEPSLAPMAPDRLGPLLAPHGLVRQGAALVEDGRWRRADLSVAELRRALLQAGASPALVASWLDARDGGVLLDVLASGTDPRTRALARLAFAHALSRPSTLDGAEAKLHWDVLIGLRNAAVLSAFDAVEAPGPVCVVYGVDHVADLQARFEGRGFARASEDWLVAVRIPHTSVGLGPVQVRQLLR